MKRFEASYTVELALLLPIVILVLMMPIYTGFRLYEETENTSVCGWNKDYVPEEQLRKILFVTKI